MDKVEKQIQKSEAFSFPVGKSMTPETEQAYLHRAENLLKTYKAETLKSWASNYILFCDWLAEHRNVWKHDTWRQNKAAVLHFMREKGPKELVDYLSGIYWERKFNKNSSTTRNTSSQKAKKFQPNDLELILDELRKNKGKMDTLLGLWLLSGSITGLRPNEWDTAVLTNRILTVQNSKNTNNRSFGPTRRIHLVNLSEKEMGYIEKYFIYLNKFKTENGDSFDSIYNLCRCRLYKITRKLFPKRKKYPTLYTCRHHLASELKSSNYSLVAAAAIFGHATDETLTTHYGKKEWGSGTFDKVLSDPEDQSKIRETNKTTRERIHQISTTKKSCLNLKNNI